MNAITYFKNISGVELEVHLKCATSGLGLVDRFRTLRVDEIFQLNRMNAGLLDEQTLISCHMLAETDIRGNLLHPVIKEEEKTPVIETVEEDKTEADAPAVEEIAADEVTAEKAEEPAEEETLTEEINFVIEADPADGFYHCPACSGKYATAKSYSRHVSSKHDVNI